MSKKITLATLKSFIRKNAASLHILTDSRFDGMSDMVERTGETQFVKVSASDRPCSHNLGIQGVWVVKGRRDSISTFDKDGFTGLRVYNRYGSFYLGVPAKKAMAPKVVAKPERTYTINLITA